MFGNLGEMAKMMQKAKDIQKNMATMKESMANAEFTGRSPSGEVIVTVSGDFMVKSVVVTAAISDTELMADLIKVATNSALSAARVAIAEQMKEVTGGLDIPGIF